MHGRRPCWLVERHCPYMHGIPLPALCVCTEPAGAGLGAGCPCLRRSAGCEVIGLYVFVGWLPLHAKKGVADPVLGMWPCCAGLRCAMGCPPCVRKGVADPVLGVWHCCAGPCCAMGWLPLHAKRSLTLCWECGIAVPGLAVLWAGCPYV